jgi:transcriptional regulator with GAF, ATPase, and Fis domain
MTESLLESELFGHSKGAFTGASTAREGAIEAADQGTVFIDEVGELPLSVQPKLLRVLESREVRRVGETHYRPVNVRFICATHRDLQTMVNTGGFREDLYFRLSVLPMTIPPLRDRIEDVPFLAKHFLEQITRQTRAPVGPTALSPELLDELVRRPWLGNVRELRNFIERFVALGAREALSLTGSVPPPPPSSPTVPRDDLAMRVLVDALERPLREARDVWMDMLERDYISRLLSRCRNNVPAAAQIAGVNRTYIYRLIRKHSL